MIRTWMGLALLAASWLFGLNWYYHAEWAVWLVLVAAGTLLLIDTSVVLPSRRVSVVTFVMLLPGAVLAPWPYRIVPLLILAGLALVAAPIPRAWPKRIGSAAALSGVVLLVQSLFLFGYEVLTARSHELPWPLTDLVGGIAGLLGVTAAVDGSSVALHSMRQVHRLGATWDLLADPVTLAFLAGGIAILAMRTWTRESSGRRVGDLTRSLGALLTPVLLWLPVRTGLLFTIYLHRVLRTDYDAPLTVLMGQFWSPWLHLALMIVPVVLAWRFLPLRPVGPASPEPSPPGPVHARRTRVAAVLLACGAVGFLATAVYYDPVGERKPGRIAVDEYHSTWEPTQRPFDTTWYGHLSGYNYSCIYDYTSRFYEMSRLTRAIDHNALVALDVLVVKVPTSRYAPEEVDAIRRFVERGGGLLLVGEHTNVFGTGAHLNDIARRFGFTFRYNCLFGIDSVFEELYQPPICPHPVIQRMPPLDFAISCSIDPGWSCGRVVMRGTGLKSAPADYHASNYYPQAEDRPEMRYGAFIQLWSVRLGAGRVLAFTDSTQFSNFCTFEPGKAEEMLGMLEWLNHRNEGVDPAPWLALAGLAAAALGLFAARRWEGAGLALIAAGVLGWAISLVAVRTVNDRAMPAPAPRRPFTSVVIDRTVCDGVLSKSGFIGGSAEGFGIFERWILRLGYFTRRASGSDALSGDLVVFFHPNRNVTTEFRDALVAYVAAGGRVLVLDSPQNKKSGANSLLWPFGLSVNHSTNLSGPLAPVEPLPATTVTSACEVSGGTPLAMLKNKPVAATTRHGKGTVTVIGFASRFTDAAMGVTGDVEPDEPMRQVFELEYALVRAIVEDRLPSTSLAPKQGNGSGAAK